MASLVRQPLAPALVCAATLLFQWPFFDRFFSAMDEGHMLYYAELVANGGQLYRDATIYPLPGAFYLLALIFEVFEPSIRLSRLVVVVEFGVFVALAFAWLRRLVAPGFAALGVALLWAYRIWAFPHWQMYSYSSTALLLLGASALLLVRFLGNGRRSTLAASGLVFGLGVFCKQDYGAAFLLASALTLLVHTRSRREATSWPLLLLTFLGPAAAVGAAAGIHFLLQGQLLRVIQLTVLNHFSGLSSYGYQAFPSLWPLFVQDPALRDHVGIHNFFPAIVEAVHGLDVRRSWWFRETPLYDSAIKLLVFGPRLLVALGALRLWRRRDALRDPVTRPRALAEVALTAVAGALALLSALNRPQDYLHLAILYWPFLCLLLVYADAFWKGSSRVARRRAALLAAPALTVVFAYSGWLGLSLRSVYPEPIPLSRAGVRVKPPEAGMLADVVGYVREKTRADESVAVMPYFPIVHFLAERRGPHAASYILWPFPEYPDRDRRIVDAMEAARTPLVIYNFTQFPHFPPVEEYAPGVFGYLVRHFTLDRVFAREAFGYLLGGLVREQAPIGEPLLADLEAYRLSVERGGGHARRVPDAQRGAILRREAWPFREVLAMAPTAGGRTVLSIDLADVPAGARLRTAIGVHPDLWIHDPPSRIHFAIAVREGASRRVVYRRVLNPHLVLADRGWFDVDVPLHEWAGRAVVVELAAGQDGTPISLPDALRLGGWSPPRLSIDPPGTSLR
jgi:hypothetical protein